MEKHLKGVCRWSVQADGVVVVSAGRVWITRDGDGADHVLEAGQQLAVRRGQQLVAEPWGASPATLAWQAAPGAAAQASRAITLRGAGLRVATLRAVVLRAVVVAARGLEAGLLALARRAASMASRAQGAICTGASMASSGALK
jgi:hypothetical protein